MNDTAYTVGNDTAQGGTYMHTVQASLCMQLQRILTLSIYVKPTAHEFSERIRTCPRVLDYRDIHRLKTEFTTKRRTDRRTDRQTDR